MTAIIASVFLILFTLGYLFFSGAIIFHLRAYTLPGWSGGRIGVLVFTVLSIVLFGLLIYSFLTAPWSAFA